MNAQFLYLILLILSQSGFAKTIQFESGIKQITLVELYSSEGCSSCPPADRQLANLRSHKNLYKTFVPIEFHVDYWNYLGWTDPFSNQQFSKRQRDYAKIWKNRSVYTPGFVVNGSEHRLWTPLPVAKTSREPGNLKVTSVDGQSFQVEFRPTEQNEASEALVVNATLLGNGLATQVPTGENAGETLRHEFVVLKHQKLNLKRSQAGVFKGLVSLKRPKSSKAKSFSVAFWIQTGDNQTPIQAVGGDLL